MQLLIDYREKWFITKALGIKKVNESESDNGTVTLNGIDMNCTTANLEVGDFIIKDDTGNIILIIERKTIKDLCASITDGRFRQQKERLLESTNDPLKVMYIIEGRKGCNGGKGVLSHTIIDGSILNLLFRHNFKVLWTENETDTLQNITLLYKKYKNNDLNSNTTGTVAPTKLVPKGTKINENMFALQLSAIPGVSYAAAIELSKMYRSMKELVDAYNSKETIQEKETMLSVFQVSEKRKLGNALAKKIYTCICGSQETVVNAV